MASPVRAFLIASLVLSPGLALHGCKKDRDSAQGSRSESPGGRADLAQLPEPHPLPADPGLAIHLGAPQALLGDAAAITGQTMPIADTATRALGALVSEELAAAIAPHADGSRPWSAAIVSGEEILYLPVVAVEPLRQALGDRPAKTEFGAVELPGPSGALNAGDDDGVDDGSGGPPPSTPSLGWIDEQGKALVLAKTPRGVATGPRLAEAYGASSLFFTVGQAQARQRAGRFPMQRLTVRGEGLHAFQLTVDGLDPDLQQLMANLGPGALPALVQAPQVALGLTARYATYEDAIRDVTGRTTQLASEQNFLLRGVFEDLAKRINTTIRTWNGRVAVGIGPAQHVLLGLGTDDPAKSERAALHLARGILDNLKLADTFGLPVPSITLKKNQGDVGGVTVHVLVVRDAKRLLRPEAAPLLDADGRLSVAFAFPPRSKAAMAVAGPQAKAALERWLGAVQEGGTPTQDGGAAKGMVTFSVSAEQGQRIVKGGDPTGLLRMEADRAPTTATLAGAGPRWTLDVKGPRPAPARKSAAKTDHAADPKPKVPPGPKTPTVGSGSFGR